MGVRTMITFIDYKGEVGGQSQELGKSWLHSLYFLTSKFGCKEDKCFREKCNNNGYSLYNLVPLTYFSSLVKIWSMEAETNSGVNSKQDNGCLDKCHYSSCHPVRASPFNLLGPNRNGNSWGMQYILRSGNSNKLDKCCLDESYQDKCHLGT